MLLPASVLVVLAAASPADPSAVRVARVEAEVLPPVLVERGADLKSAMARRRVPGLQIAVIDGFRVAWEKGYGVLQAGTDRAVTAETLFQAASISKPHTAAVALKLVDEGRLTLDGPINDALRSWTLPENTFTREAPVTLAQLLSHTAGATAPGFPGYVPGDPLPTITQILDGAAPANTTAVRIDKRPGESFRYSGGGTTVVQLAIQDVAGQPFASVMRTMLLDPLRLTHATFEQPLPSDRLANAAVGHGDAGQPIVGLRHVYPEQAAAGLWTTAGDLARFGLAIQESLAGKAGAFLKPETAKRMATAVTPPAALGFFVDAFGWKGYIAHAGGNEGFTCLLLLHREKGYGVAVMTNAERGPEVIREVARAVAREYGWEGADYERPAVVPRSQKQLVPFAGRYVFGSDTALTLRAADGHLVLLEPLRPGVKLYPVDDGTFARSDRRTRYRFEAGAMVQIDGEDRRSGARADGPDRVPSELLAADRADAARRAYERLFRANPQDPDLARDRLTDLAADRMWMGNADQARSLYEIGTELRPASAMAQYALASFHDAVGDRALAAAAYRKALSLAEADPETERFRDWAKYTWRKRAEALEAQR